MVFSLKYKSVINLGKIKEAYSRSVNDKQARKMCIGEFRVLLTVVVTTCTEHLNTIKPEIRCGVGAGWGLLHLG